MPRFQDIPQFTKNATWKVDVSWSFLPGFYVDHVMNYNLNVYPEFQRGYVWTLEQQVRYVQYILQGGTSGKDLYSNCVGWNHALTPGEYVLVDGRQRLRAVLGFLANEFPIFGGNYFRDYTDRLSITQASFRWYVNDLETRDEVMQWYIDLNAGGTVHSQDEIDKVRRMMGKEYPVPSQEEIEKFADIQSDSLRSHVNKILKERQDRIAYKATIEKARKEEQERPIFLSKNKKRRR